MYTKEVAPTTSCRWVHEHIQQPLGTTMTSSSIAKSRKRWSELAPIARHRDRIDNFTSPRPTFMSSSPTARELFSGSSKKTQSLVITVPCVAVTLLERVSSRPWRASSGNSSFNRATDRARGATGPIWPARKMGCVNSHTAWQVISSNDPSSHRFKHRLSLVYRFTTRWRRSLVSVPSNVPIRSNIWGKCRAK